MKLWKLQQVVEIKFCEPRVEKNPPKCGRDRVRQAKTSRTTLLHRCGRRGAEADKRKRAGSAEETTHVGMAEAHTASSIPAILPGLHLLPLAKI